MSEKVEIRVHKPSMNKILRFLETDVYREDCPKWIITDYYKTKDTRIRQIVCSNGVKEVYKVTNCTSNKKIQPINNINNELSEISKVIVKEYMFTVNLSGFTGIVERVMYDDNSFISVEFEIYDKDKNRLEKLIREKLDGLVTTSSLYDYIIRKNSDIQV